MSQPAEERREVSAKAAGAVTMVGQLVKIAAQFVSLIALSRLLGPHDIGLIAMLTVFLSLGEMLRDFGLSQAAIQTARLTHGQASNLFWSNTLIGLMLTSALFLAAPIIAQIYSEPALRGLAPWVALTFTINALQTQFQVRLARDLRFVALTVTDASSQVFGVVVGLSAAFAGAGYWSLVIQMLCSYGSLLTQRVLIARWRPGLPRRESGMTALYSFGFHSLLAQLLYYVAYNIDSYIIGIRWGASALGIYNRAFQMFTVPASQLLAPLTNVALPLMSQRRHNGDDFYPLLLKAQIAISAMLTLVFALAAALARPIVEIALGSAWIQSASVLSILSFGGAVQVLGNMAFWAFLASGNARQLLFSGLVTKPIQALCVGVGSFAGLDGVACGFSVGLTIAWFVSLAWLKRCDSMPVVMFLRSGIYVLFCGVIAGGVGWVLVTLLQARVPLIVVLVGGSVVVLAVYIALLALPRTIRTFLIEIIRPVLARARAYAF